MTTTPQVARPRHEARAELSSLLRSEWIKIASLRITTVLLLLAAALAAANAWAVAIFVTEHQLLASEVFAYPSVVTALLASVAGVLLYTSEVQHGTLDVVLVAHPRRWAIAVCKAAAALAWGVALGLCGMATGFVGAVASGLAVGDVGAMATTFAWALTFNGIAALLGLGVGISVRSTAGAITGLLAWWFVAENALLLVMPESASRFLPYVAGFRMLGVGQQFESPDALGAALSRVQATLVFGGYATAALIVGTLLLFRLGGPELRSRGGTR